MGAKLTRGGDNDRSLGSRRHLDGGAVKDADNPVFGGGNEAATLLWMIAPSDSTDKSRMSVDFRDLRTNDRVPEDDFVIRRQDGE